MTLPDLLVIGDVNPDVVVSGVRLGLQFDQTEELVSDITLEVGGSATITACAAARLGLTVSLCGVVGDDTLGSFMLTSLESRSVDVTRVRVDAARPTGASVVVNCDDDRAILTALGAISSLDEHDLASIPDLPARHIHVASPFLMSAECRAVLPENLARFRVAGATTSLDTNFDPAGEWDVASLMAHVDVLLPNETELLALTGTGSIFEALSAIRTLIKNDLVTALKRGDSGGLVQDASRLRHSVFPVSVGKVADAVGAGDAFNAGFLMGWVTDRDAPKCLRYAVAAGSLSTRSAGGTASQPTRDELVATAARLTARPLEGDALE